MAQPSVSASVEPGRMSELDRIGSPSAATMAWATVSSGMRTPTVFFFGCARRRGTSDVARRMNVYGPGVAALIDRNAALSTMTKWPSWAKSAHTSVKWCRSSRWRMRSAPSRSSMRQPSA
ncbi:Uncharacterised protein [Mycobacteroides abscessus]|nr:Uncharacterised protein [Mycobacteroides abscessus]